MRAHYALQKRITKKGTRYYVRFSWSEEQGRYTKTKATPYSTKAEARREAEKMLRDGTASLDHDPILTDFLTAFWSADSQYTKSKKARGKPLSQRYIDLNKWAVENFIGAYRPFRITRLSALKPALIEKWMLSRCDEGKSPRTINIALQCITVAVKWWSKQNRVAYPLEGVEKLHEPTDNERGVLSTTELVELLVPREGIPERARVAVMLSALAGLRVSEARGLRWEDIDEEHGIINVQHAVITNSEEYGKPKSGSVGEVPIPQILKDALAKLASNSKYGRVGYVLYSHDPNKSYGYKAIVRGYDKMLREAGITDEERKRRNLPFHSLRHTFISIARLSGIPDFVVQGFARHKSMQMTDGYSHAEVIDFKEYQAKLNETLTSEPLGHDF
jgi:integrase